MPHEVSSNQSGVTRALGKIWSEYLGGVNFVYINKGQAGGRLGLDHFASKPGDGTSILSLNTKTIAVMYAQQKPDYDWNKLLVPVNTFGIDPGAMIVRTDSKYKSFKEILDEAKKRKLVAAVSRWASSDGLLTYQIMELTGAQFEVVPFGSGSKTRAAVMGGHAAFGVRRAAAIVKGKGKLRALSMNMPKNPVPHIVGDIPTTSKVVGKKLLSAGSYRSIMLHRELKEKYPERFKKLVDTFNQAKNDPRYIAEAKKQGVGVFDDTSPEELEYVASTLMSLYDKYKHAYKK